ncbi:glycoside hydrolase family protein [Pedobacter sp. MW01-1-1]|uniref:glycoside hydrolase family protein n=1 Tax=Pedobacter sp. MW01-1-1 TaxID=3383027 RepID=UPI003FF13D10
MNKSFYLFIILAAFKLNPLKAQQAAKPFSEKLEFIGPAIQEPGYHVWGSSPIIAEDGRVHIFASRWKIENTFDPGWRTSCEIAHYIADKPEGPFKFKEVVLKGDPKSDWAKFGASNPLIKKVGDQYALYYIANNDPKAPNHPKSQRIGLVTAKSINGPWHKEGKDGLILSPSLNSTNWTYQAHNGVNNPAALVHPDGGIFLYFKSNKYKMGLAIAQDVKGPYVQFPSKVTKNNTSIEDGYAFIDEKGKFCLLTTDNFGIIEKGGGILWKSENGLDFNEKESGFHPLSYYVDFKKFTERKKIYYAGELAKFERPQILFINNKPAYLYVPSGTNIYGGDGTISYVLKIKE